MTSIYPKPRAKPEKTIENFRYIFLRDIDQLERRVRITTDPEINRNRDRILEIADRLKHLVKLL